MQTAEQTGYIKVVRKLRFEFILAFSRNFAKTALIPLEKIKSLMAGVAQLVELWIVFPVVEGSNPFARPIFSADTFSKFPT